jgi:hypothetical protein
VTLPSECDDDTLAQEVTAPAKDKKDLGLTAQQYAYKLREANQRIRGMRECTRAVRKVFTPQQ